MPKGTYNAVRSSGQVVEDPKHAIRLEDSDEWLGGDLSGVSVEMGAEYLLHRVEGVTMGGLDAYYMAHGRPDVILETDDDTHRFTWDREEGDYIPV